jgi:hypothetical protein
LLGTTLYDSGTVTANPGNPNVSATTPLGTPLLGIVSAGVLAQSADVTASGTAACAGLVGPNGTIQIGATGTCTVTGATGGITLTLGTNVLTAQAILESCSNTTTGGPTATLQFIGATLSSNGGPPVTLTSSQLAPNQTLINTGALATITLNNQTTTTNGIAARALTASVLSAGAGLPDAVDAVIGTVTCGNPAAVSTSVFPLASLPIAGGTLALLAVILVPWYRRRHRTIEA